MKITLFYDIDGNTPDRESIHVKELNYPFQVELSGEEENMTIKELYDKYYSKAFLMAEYKFMSEFSDIIV